MKSATQLTLIMGIIAALTSAVAAFFYPWPEPVVENDMVDQPLYEEFDASSVRSISVTRFDTDKNELDKMELRRSGEKWLIPARKNFLASNTAQISRVINALNGCTVLENRSNNQQDHIEYGVVDPTEYESATNRSSLGTKIILQDRNKKELASVIVGSTVRSDAGQQGPMSFVRIPGQPSVYVVKFDPGALSTEFTDWVSPNLLQLRQGEPISTVQIRNYRMEQEKLITGPKQWIYDATIDVKNNGRKILAPVKGSGELVEVEPTQQNNAALINVGKFLGNIRFTAIEKKPRETSLILRRNQLGDESQPLQSLQQYGFAQVGKKPNFEFNTQAGEVVVTTTEGLAVTILIGSLVENAKAGDLTLNQYVMLHAEVDDSVFPQPEKKSTDGLSEEEADKLNKAFLREQESRREKIKSARQRASELNQSFADWYYIVSENIVSGLRPDLVLESPASQPVDESISNSEDESQVDDEEDENDKKPDEKKEDSE